MPENDPQNVAFHWSTHFIRSLFEEDIRHVVISPGSRSTALTLAFSAHPGFETFVNIDERSAGFQALGLAKASGKPAVLVCTSGTAAANYYPAVIEAAQSGVPLIVLTADRPPHLRGTGASQTIDQVKLYGDYPVFFHEVGEPKLNEKNLKRLQLSAKQAVQRSISNSGVAHLNFSFSKPFEPTSDFLKQIEDENKKLADRPSAKYDLNIAPTELDETFWSDIISAEKPLIIVGPSFPNTDSSFIADLAKRINAPILAEPGSNIPTSKNNIQGFDGFLKNVANIEKLEADLILRFNQQPVSKALNNYLETCTEALQISFMHPHHWADGSLSSDKQIHLSSPLHIPEVTGSADKKWLKSWKSAEKKFTGHRKDLLTSSSPITDGFVFSEITKHLPKKSFTMLSNSFPVRDMSLFGEFDGKEIFVNRGAAGIDGITSTAIGLSQSLDKPGCLMIGDIAFLHDTNGVLLADQVSKSLVIVVLNNGGGTIFRILPVHNIKSKYSAFFETPQKTKIAALCRAHNVHHELISKPKQIIPTFKELIKQNGVYVIECMTDADKSMKQRHALWNFNLNDSS
ncbi:2-succinyl-5-enolpyruvyl-6-hydroxy-3-cyclohexene-1-carboxylic-acid synthase [Gracilimonas sp.]|uniref:2-succinyl-5-enolpyruvyl-6-hydroxy-3- cyclohexene-1-carboxylic-acid synthase n=1 Tax=Gracilimonas sp. TaxID=1974203 RepID=UPI0028718081|nr:2-succinyl-5-enolpyruvyl-6-hydroxy-3-cyclohexene-1-carboxylic-acid synthase [Gracilimonas sp.]